MALKSLDWTKSAYYDDLMRDPTDQRTFVADDWVGEMGKDGEVQPATCGDICRLCFQGALPSWRDETYVDKAHHACGLCECDHVAALFEEQKKKYSETRAYPVLDPASSSSLDMS